MNKKKVIKSFIIFIIIALMFTLYSITWYFMTQSKYTKYISHFTVVEHNLKYVLQEDGYTYFVKIPDYLRYTGNLCISTENEEYTLIIWPSLTGKLEYGVQIAIKLEEVNQTQATEYYNIELDENRKAKDSQFDELMIENKEQIDILFKKAKEEWKI